MHLMLPVWNDHHEKKELNEESSLGKLKNKKKKKTAEPSRENLMWYHLKFPGSKLGGWSTEHENIKMRIRGKKAKKFEK